MAPRRKVRQREAQLAFEALSIEGALISPEWLARVAQLAAGHQAEADYRIPKGLNLRDEIGRYWRIAQAHWADFARSWSIGAAEKSVAEQWVTALLKECLGFGSLTTVAPITKGERTYPLGWAALEGRVPVVVVGPRPAGVVDRRSVLDEVSPELGDGGRRRSAFGLAQEYLNTEDDALWAVVSDGLTLRICRDNASLTRPAWIEADLARIFAEERYADFAALWLLAHETRFGAPGTPVPACHLEAWRSAGREEGVAARGDLRDNVEEALKALGKGFLAHPENQPLRAALAGGTLTKDVYFQELLRLVYRLLFLLTSEERELLHPEGVPDGVKARYAQGYGLRRLRDRAVRRSALDRFGDQWEGLKIVLKGVAVGEPRLGLPALGGLFAADQCAHLDAARLENRALLTAIFRLSWLKGNSGLARVNWRDMGPEEMGSVYESLLELVPAIPADFRGFGFATGNEAKGNARKTTGSYYTPDSLVQVLLDSALEPVVKEAIAKNPADPAEAVLSLTVVDPACGSGHFLLAAANRLASHVARFQAKGTPTTLEYRHAIRQVVGRCLFGVDLNPMAVELCRVALWMEAMEPGRPLSFLDSHIQRGNALLGTTPELLARGIPDAAFEAIEGDDKKTAILLKRRNRAAAEGQRSFDLTKAPAGEAEAAEVRAAARALDEQADADLAGVAAKQGRWAELLRSKAYQHQKLVADAWCAAFVWPKPAVEAMKANPLVDAAPTNDLWRQLRDGQGVPPGTVEQLAELTKQYHFFHWHLAFPQVFARGGFDVVLGNPPWDSLLFQEEEFFAGTRPDIANASTAAARKKKIAKLAEEDPRLFQSYRRAFRLVDGANSFVRRGLAYPLCGVGRVNLYGLFAELGRRLGAKSGRLGQLLPSGIVTDDSTKLFFQNIVDSGDLVSFFDFENREGIFEAVHRSYKFGILTLRGGGGQREPPRFAFFATHVRELADLERQFTLSASDIALLNPATRTCPIFRSRRDAEITKGIYRRLPVLATAGWGSDLRRLLNSADDSSLFQSTPGVQRLPLYEGKHFHQFDHRWMTNDNGEDRELRPEEQDDPAVSIRTRFYYPKNDVAQRFGKEWPRAWVLGVRKIVRSTDERTFIAAIIPSLAVSDSAKVLLVPDDGVPLVPFLVGNLASPVFDFVARQKLGGINMSSYVAEQLPLIPLCDAMKAAGWLAGKPAADWVRMRTLELTYTAWDLEPFAKDVGYDGPPYRWAPARRFLLRAELDAAFFHLYGIARDDVDYIMETFPIVRRNDEKAHDGEYRTKNVILEIYDAMAEAIRTGKPYQTRLDPPPADPGMAHRARVTAGVLRIPRSRPKIAAIEADARFLWACLYASGGTVRARDLARAYSLRSHPAELARLSPGTVSAEAREWAKGVEKDLEGHGSLRTLLSELEARGAVRMDADSSGGLIKTGQYTPAGDQIDEWSVFEATLALEVLSALPANEIKRVDSQIAPDDRGLLIGKGA